MENKRILSISIIGCGWLGIPLSEQLISDGWNVLGTTTSREKIKHLQQIGIKPYLIDLPNKEFKDPELFDTDFLLINIPPGRRNPNVLRDYPKSVAQILGQARLSKKIKKVIFISSTSVYGSNEDFIDENSDAKPHTDSGQSILAAEGFVTSSKIPYIILRFGGLAGPGRHPGYFLAGRKKLDSGNQAINFLHQEDAVGSIHYMLTHDIENETYNVVAPIHPNKAEFYTKMTSSLQLEPPTFVEGNNHAKKEVSVNKLLNNTGYHFIYPNPMTFRFE